MIVDGNQVSPRDDEDKDLYVLCVMQQCGESTNNTSITNTLTYIVSTNAKTSPSAGEDGEVPLFKVLPSVRVRFALFNRFSDFRFWADNYERLLVGICGGRENREKLTG